MVSEDKCLGGLRLENSQDQDEKKKSINSAPCERSETSFALCDEVPERYMCGPHIALVFGHLPVCSALCRSLLPVTNRH